MNRAEQPIMQRDARRSRSDGPNLRITYLMNPGVEIVNQGKVTGEGIKRTFQFDTPYTKTQLQKWRDEFWGKSSFVNPLVRNKNIGHPGSLVNSADRLPGRPHDCSGHHQCCGVTVTTRLPNNGH